MTLQVQPLAAAKRLAIFLPSLGGGGAERVMVYLAEGLSDRDIEVHLVVASAEGELLDKIPTGIRLVPLAANRTIAATRRLAAYLDSARPDFLISALDHANIVAIVARALARHRPRLIVTNHIPMTESIRRARTRRDRLLPGLARLLYPRADAVVTVSNDAAADLSRVTQIPRARIRVIYNPVILPDFEQRCRQAPEHEWFRDSGPRPIVAAGRLTRQKNFPMLLEAFALLVRRQAARLVVFGEGRDREALLALSARLDISGLVDFPGFDPNVPRYFARASAFVLCSDWEALPTVLIEALASGVPIVSTDCCYGPREVLAGGRLGHLTPPGDHRALADALECAIRTGQQVPCPEAWLAQFTLPAATDAYLRLMTEVRAA